MARVISLSLRIPQTKRSGEFLSAGLFFSCCPPGKEIIAAPEDKAPAALGPYSQAVKVDSTLYVSGCIGIIPGVRLSNSLSPPSPAVLSSSHAAIS